MLGRIAGYELLEQVGDVGMGVVFRARDPRLNKIVAIKILPDALARNAEYRARFMREARAEASLDHPSIATCFAIGEAEIDPPDLIPSDTAGPPLASKLYLTMEFVPGSDLSELTKGEPIAIPRVLDLIGQIAAGLEAAHAAGVVHRDLKPANVRVTPDGRVKIIDFGLAATLHGTDGDTESLRTSHDHVMGTWHFMAPEQTRGRTTDPRSDLFSLGVILYQLVTGRLPFTGKTSQEVSLAINNTEPPPMARYANGVPDELERIVRKLLAKKLDDRYQSAHEVRTDIARLKIEPAPPPVHLKALLIASCSVLVLISTWLYWKYLWPWPWPRPWHAMAVVPLVNHTGDPQFDYLGDGIAAAVRGYLIGNSRLNVMSDNAMQKIEPLKLTAQYLRHELGVDGALMGSLKRENEQLHLDLELVEGGHGYAKWTQGYDYDLAAGGDVERQIARDVLRWFSLPVGSRLTRRPPTPHAGSAHQLLLRASSALDDPDPSAPKRALDYTTKALDQDPDYAEAWACRSRALWKVWNSDGSEETFRLAEEAADQAVRLAPELLEARLARAQVYRSTSRYAAAIRELTEVLKINPNWDEAEVQLGATYREAGDFSIAEYHFRHATQVRPGSWRNWNSLGDLRFQQLGDYAGAREAYSKVIHLVPEMNVGHTRLAAVETAAGRYDAAIDLYDRLPKPVEDGATLTNMGVAYLFKHRLEDARRYLEHAVQLVPRDIDIWINLGDLHTRAGRPDSALVCYENALRLTGDKLHVDPRNRKLGVQRIQCLAKVGNCDGARAAFAARGDTLASGNAELTHRLAKAYALCGLRDEALAAAKKAVEMGIPPKLLRDEDEFAALASDPAFPK